MGWLGTFISLVGAWHLAHRKRWAFSLLMVGNLCWAVEGAFIQKPELIVINIAMFFVAARNHYYWGRT